MLKSVGIFWGLIALTPLFGAGCSSDAASGTQSAGAGAGAAGSVEFSAGAGGAEPVDCSTLSVSACTKDTGCSLLSATLVYPECTHEEQPVACTAALGCGETNTRARDPQGQEWDFADDCLPAGWQELPWSDECGSGDGGAAGSGGAFN